MPSTHLLTTEMCPQVAEYFAGLSGDAYLADISQLRRTSFSSYGGQRHSSACCHAGTQGGIAGHQCGGRSNSGSHRAKGEAGGSVASSGDTIAAALASAVAQDAEQTGVSCLRSQGEADDQQECDRKRCAGPAADHLEGSSLRFLRVWCVQRLVTSLETDRYALMSAVASPVDLM